MMICLAMGLTALTRPSSGLRSVSRALSRFFVHFRLDKMHLCDVLLLFLFMLACMLDELACLLELGD